MTSSTEAIPHRSMIAHAIRVLSLPIVVLWVALTVVTSVFVPQLEKVADAHSVSVNAHNAPAFVAMQRIGSNFREFDSDSNAMVILEGDQPLGADAHHYYDELIRKFQADHAHVEHVADFWSDPLTAVGAQSADGKAAYVQLYLRGNLGETEASESIASVRDIIADTPAPPGVKAYVTGSAALNSDQSAVGNKGAAKATVASLVVIAVMLLFVYRAITTVILILLMVFVELGAARGIVAFMGNAGVMGLSTFATGLLTLIAIAAATDYAIFLIGRYQEARGAGEDEQSAYYTMFHGTAHVVLGSGLTIAGAVLCLKFTELPWFQSMAIPCATGVLVAVSAALTLGPAVITIGSRFGLFEPKRAISSRGWRRVGVVVVRWPGPVLAATLALSLVGLLALPSYQTDYDGRRFVPADTPANVGYAVADRHFSASRMNPELLMVETDHDLRNSADFLVIDRIAKAVLHVPGIARVQAITRPDGKPIKHTTIPFIVGMQGTTNQLNHSYSEDRMSDLLTQADEMQNSIDTMEKMMSLTQQMAATTHALVKEFKTTTADTEDLRDNIGDFDDFLRPLRNYLYWEPHCFDIPVCHTIRAIFDTLDGVDALTDDVEQLVPEMEQLDVLLPQLSALMQPQIDTMKSMKAMSLTTYATQKGQLDQQAALQANGTAMGEAFDNSLNDDTFYLPPEAFNNSDFQRGMKNFISPDGKSVRFIVEHEGDPATPEGISRIDAIKQAAWEAIKGTPLEGSSVYVGGTAATYKNLHDASNRDLMIAATAAAALIFIVMLLITRSVVAAAVIVGTVILSLGTSFGLSVLLWQHILGHRLHWFVIVMTVVLLLAVGSDYNLLLVARFKEERGGGLKTGIIRSMAGSGSVVTSAGLVFAFTMASFVVGDLLSTAQIGIAIALGLLFDTLIVRSFMTPSIAALLGRWFWWPQRVVTPASQHRLRAALGEPPSVHSTR